ncbi:MAG TPA: hypothetical protein VIL85_23915 [Thermomicrobiales bacterium]|jgi:hypothetical protein
MSTITRDSAAAQLAAWRQLWQLLLAPPPTEAVGGGQANGEGVAA